MKEKMKLFVWENVLSDYTPGLMIAVAPTVNEARKMLRKAIPWVPEGDLEEQPEIVNMTKPAVFWVGGGG